MSDNIKTLDQDRLFGTIYRFHIKTLGLVFGLLLGLTIFITTNWLVARGAQMTPGGEYALGPHLQLLGQFFIGYRVSFLGSFIGFFYGFAVGTLAGGLIGWIHNKIANSRNQ